MISEITLSLIRSFREPLTSFFSDFKDEFEQLFNVSLAKYIDSHKAKIELTKTFLFRDEKVDFYYTYFPVSLKFKNKSIKINSIESLYEIGTNITIIGNAGSGKSMLLKHIFLNAIKQKVKIPIYIELRSLNHDDNGVIEYIKAKILNSSLSKNTKILEKLLKTGEFIFLFDGYDEIYSQRKQKLTHDLENFIDTYYENWFIMTSRPGSEIESFPRFNNAYIEALTNNEIINFIDKQCSIIDDIELGQNIKSSLRKSENRFYENYLNNPLLLSMFLFTFRNIPELPKKRSRFYWNVFTTLITKHDSFTKKGGWQHERKSRLQNEDIEVILQWFSYISFFKGEYFEFEEDYLEQTINSVKRNFSLNFNTKDLIYDLSVNLNLLILDGLVYSFPHRSLQEYFAVKLISLQSEEAKKSIYQKKLIAHSIKSSPSSILNLWRLCEEMDKEAFQKYFLLVNLEKFKPFFEWNSPHEAIENYYEQTTFKFSAIHSNNSYTQVGIINDTTSIISRSILYYLINFHAGRFEQPQIISLLNNEKNKDVISLEFDPHFDIFNRPDYYVFDPLTNNHISNVILTSNDLTKGFEKISVQLKDIYIKIKREIAESNERNINLLI